MVTIKDIAKKADVSIATVSLALNNSDKIKDETIARVKEVAREMNYIPNHRGRALVKGVNNTIGLLIPEIENPFYGEVIQEIKNVLYEKDFHLILGSTDYKVEEEKRYINLFQKGMIDGAIFAGFANPEELNEELIYNLAHNFIPVVFAFRKCFNEETVSVIPAVNARLKKALYMATSYLIELGHEKIAFVGKSAERLAGYKQALDEYNIPVRDEYIFNNYNKIEHGVEVGEKIMELSDRPTGLACFNDEIALGIIQVLANQGLKIPENISVVGCDNIKMANFSNPPLTTVDISKRKMARKAARILLELISEGDVDYQNPGDDFSLKLIKRGSVISHRKTK
ncbi:MAG: LacI family DNA-binding transcriptional regulator [bacterium]